MLVLRVDIESFVRDFAFAVIDFANSFAEDIMRNMQSRFRTTAARNDVEIIYAEYISGRISVAIESGVHAILDSFGTGSKMDITNEALGQYMGTDFWNPERRNFAITGRRKGKYKNIFGETVESKGTYAGKNIEHIVEPKKPSMAIQNAEKIELDRRLDRYLNDFVPDWIANNAYKYFYNANG